MPNRKSAKKDLRQSIKRKIANKKINDGLKSLVKKSLKAIESKDKEAKELVSKTLKVLDKAVQKGVIKKNTGSRKKSRLTLKLNKILK